MTGIKGTVGSHQHDRHDFGIKLRSRLRSVQRKGSTRDMIMTGKCHGWIVRGRDSIGSLDSWCGGGQVYNWTLTSGGQLGQSSW